MFPFSTLCRPRLALLGHIVILLMYSRERLHAEGAHDLREGITSRLRSLRNVSVAYYYEQPPTQSEQARAIAEEIARSTAQPGIKSTLSILEHESGEGTFNFFEGRARYEIRTDEATSEALRTDSVTVFNQGVFERLVHTPDAGFRGTINDKEFVLPRHSLIDVALGLRVQWEDREWLSEERIGKDWDIRLLREDLVEATFTDSYGRKHSWSMNPKLDYAIENYKIGVPPDGNTNLEYEFHDLRSVNGTMLPYSIQRRVVDPTSGEEVSVTDIKIREYKLNDPENTRERFTIAWPEGTTVVDHRGALEVYTMVKGVLARDVRGIRMGEALDRLQVQTPSESLAPGVASQKAEAGYALRQDNKAKDPEASSVWLLVAGIVILGGAGILVCRKRGVSRSPLN